MRRATVDATREGPGTEGGSPRISVVIPVFDEAHRIARTVETVCAWLRPRGPAEVIVVSDGSRDDPAAQVPTGPRDGVEVRLLELPENRGKGAAVREGVLAARGERVLFSDADLATPIEEAARLEEALDAGADLAIASRRCPGAEVQVPQSFLRRGIGEIFPRLVRLLTGLPYGDTQCGFKMFPREIARTLFGSLREEGFAFDVELLHAARSAGWTIAEIGVVWRDSGESTVRILRDPWRMAVALVRLADRRRYPRLVLRQAVVLGMLFAPWFVGAGLAFTGSSIEGVALCAIAPLPLLIGLLALFGPARSAPAITRSTPPPPGGDPPGTPPVPTTAESSRGGDAPR